MKWFLRWTASYTSPNLPKSNFSPHQIQKVCQALDLYKQILIFFITKRFHFVSNLSPLILLENTIFSKHTTSQKSVGDHYINDTFRLEQFGYMSPDIRCVYPSSACSYRESEGLAVLKHLGSVMVQYSYSNATQMYQGWRRAHFRCQPPLRA